jgi:hypothetical protein
MNPDRRRYFVLDTVSRAALSADDRAVFADYQRNQVVHRRLVGRCDSSGADRCGAASSYQQRQGCAYRDADKPRIENAESARRINHRASPSS